MNIPVYINFTNQEKYNRIKTKIENNQLEDDYIEQYNHTLFIVNTVGLPAINASSCDFYLGSQIISDIINLNSLKEITIVEDKDVKKDTVVRFKGSYNGVTFVGASKKQVEEAIQQGMAYELQGWDI